MEERPCKLFQIPRHKPLPWECYSAWLAGLSFSLVQPSRRSKAANKNSFLERIRTCDLRRLTGAASNAESVCIALQKSNAHCAA